VTRGMDASPISSVLKDVIIHKQDMPLTMAVIFRIICHRSVNII